MPLASLIGAAGNIIGGLIGADTAAANNAAQQRRQLQWEREKFAKETELANTAHQREIADLKAAGINPVLTATGGNGAATPQGGSIGTIPDTSGQILSGSINAATNAFLQGRELQMKRMLANKQAELLENQGAEAAANAVKHIAESGLFTQKEKESIQTAYMQEQQGKLYEKQQRILQGEIDNLELKREQLIEEINMLKENIKTEPTKRAKNAAQENLIKAEEQLTRTKQALYKLAHIAGIVASAATGVGGMVGAVANTGKIVNMIKGGTKIVGFMK